MPHSQITTRSWPCYLTKIISVLKYGAAIWGGLPEYLADEIESTQNRCLKILGISRDNLKSLRERREHIAIEELTRNQIDATHPCNKFLPFPTSHTHDLRRNSCIPYPIWQYLTLKDPNNLLSQEQLLF
jgi:hypothetical protein